MVKRKEVHVVPNSERGGWDSKRNNSQRASKHFDIKAEAMEYARNQARNIGAELIPHGRDGKIQNPNSYGSDPCHPRDKKH